MVCKDLQIFALYLIALEQCSFDYFLIQSHCLIGKPWMHLSLKGSLRDMPLLLIQLLYWELGLL